jgi:lantibiotic modifying enzyme
MAGIIAALARRPELMPLDALACATSQALAATAVREGTLANWSPARQERLEHRSGTIRTQWCHGAPGVVASLTALPHEDQLDSLLTAGGELTWTAGPLRKGANLCHGTSGNGFAFLKLFTRTGDESWLERARRFALHASAQVATARREYGRGRYSLWTGDLGTAVYLHQCITGTSEMLTLDTF